MTVSPVDSLGGVSALTEREEDASHAPGSLQGRRFSASGASLLGEKILAAAEEGRAVEVSLDDHKVVAGAHAVTPAPVAVSPLTACAMAVFLSPPPKTGTAASTCSVITGDSRYPERPLEEGKTVDKRDDGQCAWSD